MTTSTLSLSSTAFENDSPIPARYTCDGEQRNPPLAITGVPEGAKSLTLIMDDPDIPQQVKDSMHIDVFDHWTLFNIPPDTTAIAEGEASLGTTGLNGAGKSAYTGPCPPSAYEPKEHRYFFKLYALDALLPLDATASKADVESAMQGHVLAEAELVGRYQRQ